MKQWVKDQKILITGGTGNLARALLPGLLALGPEAVYIFSRDEFKHFEMMQEYSSRGDVKFIIGDVRSGDRLRMALKKIDVVFHFAAMKHVHSCEKHPFEATETNVVGTKNIIESSIEMGVKKVIAASTDKAANPSSTMGITKLLAERMIVAANIKEYNNGTIFTNVRFGNILGTRGSMVPNFRRQIETIGKVRITDEGMVRYVMTPKEAIELTRHALVNSFGGETFICKMPRLKVADLAKVVIEEYSPKCGFDPDAVKIETIGIQPGEKLEEDLLTGEELRRAAELEEAFVLLPPQGLRNAALELRYKSRPEGLSWEQVHSSKFLDPAAIKELLKREMLI